MKTNTIQDRKINFQEKIAKGLKIIIEGCLEGAQDLNNNLKTSNRREPMIEGAINGLLINAQKYLDIAEGNSYFSNENQIRLRNRYQALKQSFQELKK